MNTIPCCERALAKMAVRALYFEVKAYPKPGLVSFTDSGAHRDMNGETFYRSLVSLRHYFYRIAQLGTNRASFAELKQTAIEAEQQMLTATSGINTHRGALFALGIFCVSVRRLVQKQKHFNPDDLHQQILNDWRHDLEHHQTDSRSHGAAVRKTYTIIDARIMAIRGYDLIFTLLPKFIEMFLSTHTLDTVCLFAYLELLVQLDDTNILYKKGKLGLDFAQAKAEELRAITCYQVRKQKALELHNLFSEQGISPGGVADLISVLLFLGQLFCEEFRYLN